MSYSKPSKWVDEGNYTIYHRPIVTNFFDILGYRLAYRIACRLHDYKVQFKRLMKNSKSHASNTPQAKHLLTLSEILSSKRVLNHLTDGFIILNTHWEYVYLNKKAEALLHVKLKQIEKKHIWTIFPNLKKSVFEKEYKSVLNQKKPREFVGYNDRVDKWFYVRVFPIVEGIIVYFSDITEHEQARQKLKESEALYRIVVDNSHDLITILDLSGNFLYSNPSYKDLLGYSKRSLLGKNIFDLIHIDDREKAEKDFKKIVRSGFSESSFRCKHANGMYRMLEGSGSRVSQQGKNPEMVVAILRDITERTELDKRKDDFINMASHELNAPVTSLMMYAKLLRKRLAQFEGSDASAFVGKMDSQIVRLRELIGDLLDLSRIQAGKLQYRQKQIPLHLLLSEVCDMMRQTTDTHKTKLVIKDEISVSGDKNRLSQVIINLLSNAYKYSPTKSEVVVTLGKKGQTAVISVQDFGIGISKRDQQRIFERFYQIAHNNGSHPSGLGIGLHISSEIVAHHKGKMWVISTKGKGSTFFVSLPI